MTTAVMRNEGIEMDVTTTTTESVANNMKDDGKNEEQRLRERLKNKSSKMSEEEEQRLRERLKAKSENRRGAAAASENNQRESNDSGRRSTSRGRSPPPSPRRSSSSSRRDGGPRRRGSSGSHGNNNGRGRPDYDDRRHRVDGARHSRSPPVRHFDHRRANDYDDFGRRRRGGHYEDRRSRSHRSRSRSPPRGRDSRGSNDGRRSSNSRHHDDEYDRYRRQDDRRERGGSRHREEDDRRNHGRRHRQSNNSRRGRSRSPSAYSTSSSSSSGGSSSSSASGGSSVSSSSGAAGPRRPARTPEDKAMDNFTKDQRTVFVSQLVMRATEREIKKWFKTQALPFNEVILLRDKAGHFKGAAYVELRDLPDVPKAVALSGQVPSFQRFPLLIKASEAERNYLVANNATVLTAAQLGVTGFKKSPMEGPDGQLQESQKVYVGNLDPSITQEHLFVLYVPFGNLEKVSMQMDPSTGLSKGFAFLSFNDPAEANLAIQTMSQQSLAGRPMKTGWANQVATHAGIAIVTSDQFPENATFKAQTALQVLAQLTMGVPPSSLRPNAQGVTTIGLAVAAAPPMPTSAAARLGPMGAAASAAAAAAAAGGPHRVPTVAEARASLAAGMVSNTVPQTASSLPPKVAVSAAAPTPTPPKAIDAKQVGNADQPTPHILVHNMFDKDTETEVGWQNEIREDFEEEAAKFGTLRRVVVLSEQPGGKIYASFADTESAQKCAATFAGRWFDQRQLRVEFVAEADVPPP